MTALSHIEQIRSHSNSYSIKELLSANDHSRIYLCSEVSDPGALRILKLFSSVTTTEEDALRIANEIHAMCSIQHPNVIRGIETVQHDQFAGLLMEYAAGGTLSARLASEQRLEVAEAVAITIQLCEGLEAIHAAGFVHRGLQPSNILFAADGTVKITDFGFVKELNGISRLTQGDGILGSVEYASPEYIEYGMLDRRSDVYALGALLFKMLTGRGLFPASTVVESIMQRLSSEPAQVHTLLPDCPLELSGIVERALRRNPFGRYESPRAMLEDLEQLQSPAHCSRPALPDVWTHQIGLLNDESLMLQETEFDGERVYLTQLERLGDWVLTTLHGTQPFLRHAKKRLDELQLRSLFLQLGRTSIEISEALFTKGKTAAKRVHTYRQESTFSLESSGLAARLHGGKRTSRSALVTALVMVTILGIAFSARTIFLAQATNPQPTLEQSTQAAEPEPSKVTEIADASTTQAKENTPAEAPAETTYRIQRGDTLSKIASRFNISVAALGKRNEITNPHQLRVGALLSIPAS